MAISSFFFTFEQEGSYLFGDYSDTKMKQTLFVISEQCAKEKSVMPMTIANLKRLKVGVYHGPMHELSEALILIPIGFILFAIGVTAGLSYMESYIKRREQEEFERKHGKLA